MIPIHHSMKIIQAPFREWDHPFHRLPQSRELSKRKSDSDGPSSTRQVVYHKGQPTATPILIYEDSPREVLQQLLIWCRHSISILTVRLSAVLLPNGLRICCVGFTKLIKPTVIAANTGEDGAVKSLLNISVSCTRNFQTRPTRATWRWLRKSRFSVIWIIRP